MQSVLSKIWTHVAVSISYDDNHYTTGTSIDIPLNKVTKIKPYLLNDLHCCIEIIINIAYNFLYCLCFLQVKITLLKSTSYLISEKPAKTNICICGGKSHTAVYTIIPLELGSIDINVTVSRNQSFTFYYHYFHLCLFYLELNCTNKKFFQTNFWDFFSPKTKYRVSPYTGDPCDC